MPSLRLLIIAIAAVCMLALAAFAVVHRPPQDPSDDVIIIKGGSLTIDCKGPTPCLGAPVLDPTTQRNKYSHLNYGNHVTKIVVKATNGAVLFDSSDARHCGGNLGGMPVVEVSYKK